MASSKQSRLRALVAIIDAQIVLALAWVETLLQLRELQAQLQTHFLDLMKVDLLLQYWACRYLRHSRLPRHSSSSVTGCGARKLAVTGRRLLVLLLKRRCAALTWILASRMLRWSSKAKSIQSTRSALSENLPSLRFLLYHYPDHAMGCSWDVQSPILSMWAVISHQLLRYAVARKMSL